MIASTVSFCPSGRSAGWQTGRQRAWRRPPCIPLPTRRNLASNVPRHLTYQLRCALVAAFAGITCLVVVDMFARHMTRTQISGQTVAQMQHHMAALEMALAGAHDLLKGLERRGVNNCARPLLASMNRELASSAAVDALYMADATGRVLCVVPGQKEWERLQLAGRAAAVAVPPVFLGLAGLAANDARLVLALRLSNANLLIAELSGLATRPAWLSVGKAQIAARFFMLRAGTPQLIGPPARENPGQAKEAVARPGTMPDGPATRATAPPDPVKQDFLRLESEAYPLRLEADMAELQTAFKAAHDFTIALYPALLFSLVALVVAAIFLHPARHDPKRVFLTNLKKNGRLTCRYIPVIHLGDGKIFGAVLDFEWYSKADARRFSAREMLAHARILGVTEMLVGQVLRQSVSQIGPLFRENKALRLIVGLDLEILLGQAFFDTLNRIVEASPLFHAQIIVDMPLAGHGADRDSALSHQITPMLAALRRTGVRTMLHDTHGSTVLPDMARTHRFDHIAIGRGVLHNLATGSLTPEAVRAELTHAGEVGMTMIAMQIETSGCLALARKTGLDLVSGRHIAPHLDAAGFSGLVSAMKKGGPGQAVPADPQALEAASARPPAPQMMQAL